MNYFMYYPFYPVIYPCRISPQMYIRNYFPNVYYAHPPYDDYRSHYAPTYPVNKTDHSLQKDDYSRSNVTVRFQNLGNSKFKDWYLDIDGNTGKVLLTESYAASGINWRMTSLGGTTITLQNLGNSKFKGWYLDIDGNTGAVILTESPTASGIRWRLISLGGTTITLQNLGNSRFKDWYLDINGNTGTALLTESNSASGIKWRLTNLNVSAGTTNIAEQAIIICISGRGGAGPGGISDLRNTLQRELVPLGVKPDNIIRANWNYKNQEDPSLFPSTQELLGEISSRSRTPSYLAIIGHSYGGWAACKLSRVTSRVPDFIGLIDPVFGYNNTFTSGDIPRGNFIKNWYQNNSIVGGDPCTGAGKIPCSRPSGGISCGYKDVTGAHEIVNEHFLKNWDGSRKSVSCGASGIVVSRPHLLTSHVNIDDDKWIHRQIRDRIYADLSKRIYS
ncbi:RICIN domain-containing protein [Priestia megaterium]|uniref:RICIN domain-containing protein n=1 Tax=Priestia megaterium TaxID=1404 RepID=UPI0021ABB300|nr:RICIN domain-containing protein [Priestia megaterium]MCR8927516.1 RICIN domain-containing protein [Priestia megaterium]